jgi:hypothetical protein
MQEFYGGVILIFKPLAKSLPTKILTVKFLATG